MSWGRLRVQKVAIGTGGKNFLLHSEGCFIVSTHESTEWPVISDSSGTLELPTVFLCAHNVFSCWSYSSKSILLAQRCIWWEDFFLCELYFQPTCGCTWNINFCPTFTLHGESGLFSVYTRTEEKFEEGKRVAGPIIPASYDFLLPFPLIHHCPP